MISLKYLQAAKARPDSIDGKYVTLRIEKIGLISSRVVIRSMSKLVGSLSGLFLVCLFDDNIFWTCFLGLLTLKMAESCSEPVYPPLSDANAFLLKSSSLLCSPKKSCLKDTF